MSKEKFKPGELVIVHDSSATIPLRNKIFRIDRKEKGGAFFIDDGHNSKFTANGASINSRRFAVPYNEQTYRFYEARDVGRAIDRKIARINTLLKTIPKDADKFEPMMDSIIEGLTQIHKELDNGRNN